MPEQLELFPDQGNAPFVVAIVRANDTLFVEHDTLAAAEVTFDVARGKGGGAVTVYLFRPVKVFHKEAVK